MKEDTMKIENIVVKYMPTNTSQPLPQVMELDPTQGALIPLVGDRVLGPGFSMDVVLRKFELTDGTLYVFLVG